MKILTLDIETSPNLGYVWSLWKQNIGLSQLVESGEVICFAAKWYDSDEVIFASKHHDGKQEMLNQAYNLISQADVIVHYNGKTFDMKHLNREFLLAGFTPPAPYAQVDLLNVVKQQFRFVSNKLDYVVQALGMDGKTSHTGFQLWLDCLAGDEAAWALMQEYNEHDVVLTEQLYTRLLPWIATHPAVGLYDHPEARANGVVLCPNCGGDDLKPRGRAYTSVSIFQRYRCEECGKWSRGSARLEGVAARNVV